MQEISRARFFEECEIKVEAFDAMWLSGPKTEAEREKILTLAKQRLAALEDAQ